MIEQIEQALNNNGIVKIKLYSLIYNIEVKNSKYVIYADYYQNNKKEYNSLLELLKKYEVYNESIFENIEKVNFLG